MAINQVREKKQPKVMRFSNFVAKASGNNPTRRLALRSKLVREAEDIEADDTSSAFCAIIDGDSPYQERKAVMDLFYQLCLDSCEGGGRVFATAVAVR
jgi:hypothetical protein